MVLRSDKEKKSAHKVRRACVVLHHVLISFNFA